MSQEDSIWNKMDIVFYSGASSEPVLFNEDMKLMKQAFTKRKLLIGEYLLSEQPEHLLRKSLEGLMEVEYSGWRGKFFASLDSTLGNIPLWLIKIYNQQHASPYDFSDIPGIILVRDSTEVVVLSLGKELEQELPVINTPSLSSDGFAVPEFIHYTGWFEVTTSLSDKNVFASFNINTSEKGDSVFKHHNLPAEFPAIIGDSAEGLRFYFCGDFSCNEVPMYTAPLMGIHFLDKLFYNNRDFKTNRKFFWEYYAPLISDVLLAYQPASDSLQERQLPAQAILYNTSYDAGSVGGDLDEEVSRVVLEEQKETTETDQQTEPLAEVMEEEMVKSKSGELPAFVGQGITGRQPYDENSKPRLNIIFNVDLAELRKASRTSSMDYTEPSVESKQWRIVVSSLKSRSRAEKYANSFNKPDVSIHYISELDTHRVVFSSHQNLREAQESYQLIVNRHPDAWIVYF